MPGRDEWDGLAAFYPWLNRMLRCRPQRSSSQLLLCVHVVFSERVELESPRSCFKNNGRAGEETTLAK